MCDFLIEVGIDVHRKSGSRDFYENTSYVYIQRYFFTLVSSRADMDAFPPFTLHTFLIFEAVK